jgi:hypothetical protein
MPVTAAAEYQHNLQAVGGAGTATSLRVDVGRRQQRGDWGFGWHVFRSEQDAIISALGESDWRAPSNVSQHRIAVNRMFHPNVQGAFTWYRGRTLDQSLRGALVIPGLPAGAREPWMNRIYLDVIYRF